jgi:squalene cyclase
MPDLVPQEPAAPPRDPRWKFLRDVAVFELKLTLNNIHNFFQVPLTLVVALVDLVFRHGEEGSRFYWLVEQGRIIDDHIDIYSIIDHRERALNKDYTVDAVLKRIEGAIVREYDKGGTAASVKDAVDRAFDEMQTRTAPASAKAAEATGKAMDAMRDAAERFRSKGKDDEAAKPDGEA